MISKSDKKTWSAIRFAVVTDLVVRNWSFDEGQYNLSFAVPSTALHLPGLLKPEHRPLVTVTLEDDTVRCFMLASFASVKDPNDFQIRLLQQALIVNSNAGGAYWSILLQNDLAIPTLNRTVDSVAFCSDWFKHSLDLLMIHFADFARIWVNLALVEVLH